MGENFPDGNFLSRNFPGGGFNRWEFSGGEGSFPAGIFLEPVKKQFLMFS